jgi:hypothetical protein
LSFDDLFALLLFVIFIGLPLLNRMQQRGRGRTPPGAPPPGSGRPGPPGRAPGQPPGPAGGAASAGERAAREREARAAGEQPATASQRDDEDPFAELAKRLEEARRRVRDASSPQASTAPAPARTVATPSPPSQPMPTARPPKPRPPRAARDPFPTARTARPKPTAPWERTAQRRTKLAEDAPALEVERRPRVVSGAERREQEIRRLQADDLVALNPSSFRKGMLWHLVLSDPVAYRNRRKPSPPASR